MHGCWAAPALLALGQPPLPLRDRIWPSVGNKQGWNANVVPPEYVYEVRKGEKARQVAQLNVDRRRTMEAEITSHAVDFIRRNANATPTRSMHTFHSRWSTFRRSIKIARRNFCEESDAAPSFPPDEPLADAAK